MSSSFESSHPRFLRPIDVARIRRNQNRIHVQRVLRLATNVVVAGALLALAVWLYQRTHSDTRFAVRAVHITGAVHTSRAEVDAIVARYVGANLFRIDIADVQGDLSRLPWVSRIEIEKKLPDTLRIRVVERVPVALAQSKSEFRYVDETGVPFAPLSVGAGNPDLPLIAATDQGQLARAVGFIRHLRSRDPELYARISEVRPIPPHGFAFFDRDLRTFVYANPDDLSRKWRDLYALADAENLRQANIEYADLRFADRIVVKPRTVPVPITN